MSTTEAEVDLDEVEDEIRKRISDLERRRQQLALAALSDKSAVLELPKIEGRLGSAEVELQRLGLARAEQERLEIEARQAEVDERQAAAYEQARRLQSRREQTAAAIDRAAGAHVEAVCDYLAVCLEQRDALRQAGRPEAAHLARPFGFAVEAAFAYALQDKWSPVLREAAVFSRLGFIPMAHKKPLVKGDARPVEPLED